MYIKKLDKLLLQMFLRYFVLILPVLILLLLIQYLLKYFDDLVGKGVEFFVFVELLFYFSVNMIPLALNLAVMIAALMTYGSLGEYSELTAIKTSGISSPRLLQGVFLLVLGFSLVAFFANAYYIPKINLKAYLLLHDITHKKPAFNLQENQFYSAIPGYSVQVQKKLSGNILQKVMIYNHNEENPNAKHKIVIADSGRMYRDSNEEYLYLELFDGHYYVEAHPRGEKKAWNDLIRTRFEHMNLIFSLSALQLKRSAEDYFAHLRKGKQIHELFTERDSMLIRLDSLSLKSSADLSNLYLLQGRYREPLSALTLPQPTQVAVDSVPKKELFSETTPLTLSSASLAPVYSKVPFSDVVSHVPLTQRNANLSVDKVFLQLWGRPPPQDARDEALKQVKYMHRALSHRNKLLQNAYRDIRLHELEAYTRYALAFSCIVMFLIGASIGGIVKKGGLGVPILIAICVFIVYHIVSTTTRKYAIENLMSTATASWSSNIILSAFAVIFLILLTKDVALWEKGAWRLPIRNFFSFFSRK